MADKFSIRGGANRSEQLSMQEHMAGRMSAITTVQPRAVPSNSDSRDISLVDRPNASSA